MRSAVVIILSLYLFACGDDGFVPPPDAAPNTFGVEIGEACDAATAPLCARGFGRCVESVCRQQCSGHYPACTGGLVEHRADDGACWCE